MDLVGRGHGIDALLAANPLWYPLRYPGEYHKDGQPSTINRVIHYHYPTADDMAQIRSLRTFRDFGGGSLFAAGKPLGTLSCASVGITAKTPGASSWLSSSTVLASQMTSWA